MLDHIEPYSARQAVETAADGFIDIALHCLQTKTAESIDEVLQSIADESMDDTAAFHMSLEDQMHLLEHHGDEAEGCGKAFTLDNLRGQIESMSCSVIHRLAQQVAEDFFTCLDEVMDEHDLDLSQMSDGNAFGWAVHRAERDEGEHCTVYEYRNADECDVDIWHFFRGSWEVYFQVWIGEANTLV